MPARFAISAVGLAWIPRDAMTGIAAAMTASRRSSAVESVRVAVGAIGVSMHSLTPAVKSRSSDLANDAAGVADRDDSGWDVLRDDAARPDHARASDRHARKDDGTAPEPDIVLDRDSCTELASGGALLGVERVVRGQELHGRCHLHAIADRHRHDIQDHAVEVHEDVVADRDVVAVVAEERWADVTVLANRSEQLLQHGGIRVRVVFAQRLFAAGTVGNQLRIAGDVQLARDHLLLFGARQLRRCSIACSSLSMTGPSCRRIRRRSQPVRVTSRMRVFATTVALRCCFSRTPASPKKSPGPSSATTSPPTIT